MLRLPALHVENFVEKRSSANSSARKHQRAPLDQRRVQQIEDDHDAGHKLVERNQIVGPTRAAPHALKESKNRRQHERCQVDDDLLQVMKNIIADGDPQNFKKDGSPKAAVINRALGRAVGTDARTEAYEAALNDQ